MVTAPLKVNGAGVRRRRALESFNAQKLDHQNLIRQLLIQQTLSRVIRRAIPLGGRSYQVLRRLAKVDFTNEGATAIVCLGKVTPTSPLLEVAESAVDGPDRAKLFEVVLDQLVATIRRQLRRSGVQATVVRGNMEAGSGMLRIN